MANLRVILVLIAILAAEAVQTKGKEEATVGPTPVKTFGRSSFPAGFVFGAASAAYQVEGAAKQGGRGPSIWDYFTEKHPGWSTKIGTILSMSSSLCVSQKDVKKIMNGSNGDVAIDMYHRYKEDVGHMNETGIDAFRFSISWSRILPTGKISGGINKEGVQYYNHLIDELLSKGIQPYATIFHWDLPQSLDAEYGGFLSPRVVVDFKNYADLVFKLYGDRVKHWITFNEPYSFCQRGYAVGAFAPGRCSKFMGCAAGDSGREPYIAGHNLLLAHAVAVKVYRDNYQASQKGEIGITLVTHWFRPYSVSKADFDAATRALDFYFGWFMDPIATGDYPFTMRAILGDRLPKFTVKESEMIKGSFDFLGLNYYTTQYARSISFLTERNITYDDDIHAFTSGMRNGKPIGAPSGSDWLLICPSGIRSLVLYIKEKYDNPIIYITENGVDTLANASLPLEEVLKDDMRIGYHRGHLLNLNKAISEGANVKGYFPWSMFDSFEWDAGYTVRFGLYYVDYNTLKRIPKKSAIWYRSFLDK